MDRLNIDNLRVRASGWREWRYRLWREWCFLVAIVRHRGLSIGALILLLLVGSELLAADDMGARADTFQRVYAVWNLIFGQPVGELPTSWWGRSLLFILPILGLTVIVETIVEVGSMVRDRRSHEQSWCTIMSQSMSGHVVLVGLGKLGFRTFSLLRKLGRRVVVIECNGQNKFLDDVRRDGSPLLVGDARRDKLLEDANVAEAESIILATSDDMVNLEAALDARRLNPRIRVILRMFDQQMADKVRDGFNIKLAMSQSAISAPAFATAAIEPSIVGSVVVSDRLIVMMRWSVGQHPGIAGMTVGELLQTHGVSVVERTSPPGAAELFPPPITRIDRGDELLLQGPFETLMSLRGSV
jgi:voltage-gated potassium channel